MASASPGELVSLDSLGITKAHLAATPTSVMGQRQLDRPGLQLRDRRCKTHAMADVWFATQPVPSNAPADLRTNVNGAGPGDCLLRRPAIGDRTGAASTRLDLSSSSTATGKVAMATNVGGLVMH